MWRLPWKPHYAVILQRTRPQMHTHTMETNAYAHSRPRRRNSDFKHVIQTYNCDSRRGGPSHLNALELNVIRKTSGLIVLNKGFDQRLDGNFDATIEKALHRDYPDIAKFRWIHQLDFATSGVLCVGTTKEATSLGCRLFRERKVEKEYLAIVSGHLPFSPLEYQAAETNIAGSKPVVQTCVMSKLKSLIQDMEKQEVFYRRLETEGNPNSSSKKDVNLPKGPRPGPTWLHMAQAKIKRDQRESGHQLTGKEEAILFMRWKVMSKSEKEPFLCQANTDHARFIKELQRYKELRQERISLERRYEQSGTDDAIEDEDSLEMDVVGKERMAYVLNFPIHEPSPNSFEMEIVTNTTDGSEKRGKDAVTIAYVLGHGYLDTQPVTKVLLRPLSGRRHQLRLHLKHIGFPILGDATYGSANPLFRPPSRMMLHAWKLWFNTSETPIAQDYGDLNFETPDPFQCIVHTSDSITTLSRSQLVDDRDGIARSNTGSPTAQQNQHNLASIALCNLRRINMNKLSGVISLAVIVASAYAQVTVMDAAGSPQMKIEQSTPGHSEDSKNVLTDATALVNKNTAVVDNNIGVSDSNVLLSQNDLFHVKKQSGTIHVRGASENEENEDQDQEYFWRGGYGYPSYGYNYRYRNWW
uniref:RNA pseudouridylate synthaselike protein putative n=1 Tax=Albugo laibachii Nc14 TaxID=890382 RepID=F0WJU9_9STRA|nr:RNA pseudouridylate synthaselike protein putative [Albugo laibachii Nc14]|eukprot:CCA21551.1 RNA pseudouridylate synthaselike protein putative [Albugo laibachii Nc14]